MSDALIEFTLDARYFDEFHAQWVASLGRGWRVHQVMVPVFIAVGMGMAAAGTFLDAQYIRVPGVLFLLFGGYEFVKGRRRKAQWLTKVQSLLEGKRMCIELDKGLLVQKNDFEGDPRFERTGELVDTPDGYLLRYLARADVVEWGAVSTTSASVYIPHRVIKPTMTREEFRRLLSSSDA